MESIKEAFSNLTNRENKNDNTYDNGLFSVSGNLLITTYATIPLKNISKIWVGDLAKRIKLSKWFWICGIVGIILFLSSLASCSESSSSSYGSSYSYSYSSSDDLFGSIFDFDFSFMGIGIVLILIAIGLLAYYSWKNNQHDYALFIEANSGSTEIYRSWSLSNLYAAQNYLQKGIQDCQSGLTVTGGTFNINSGKITNDIIVHGSNSGSVTGGYNNTGYGGSRY